MTVAEQGNPSAPGIAASGAQYTVTAIPLAYIAPSANKYAACGIDDIVANAPSGAGITQQTAVCGAWVFPLAYVSICFWCPHFCWAWGTPLLHSVAS